MKTLYQAAVEFERSQGARISDETEGAPFFMCPARSAFIAGAAAMAEQFAQGQGTVLQLIRDLAEIQTRNAQLLAERIKELRQVEAEKAGLSHWTGD